MPQDRRGDNADHRKTAGLLNGIDFSRPAGERGAHAAYFGGNGRRKPSAPRLATVAGCCAALAYRLEPCGARAEGAGCPGAR